MPITLRSGNGLENKAEYYGRYGRINSTLPGQRKNKTRVKTRSEQANQPPPPTFSLPSTPPDLNPSRLLRYTNLAVKPCCSNYGPSRKILYPLYHFCSPCWLFDNDSKLPELKNVVKRTAKQYKCTAGHKSRAYPTRTTRDYLETRHGKRGRKNKESSRKKRRVSRYDSADGKVDANPTLTMMEDQIKLAERDSKIDALERSIEALKDYNAVVTSEIMNMNETVRKYEMDKCILSDRNRKLCDDLSAAMMNDNMVREHMEGTKERMELTIKNLKEVNSEQNTKFDILQNEIQRTSRKLAYQTHTNLTLLDHLGKRNINNTASGEDVISLFVDNLVRVSNEKNRNPYKLAKLVVDALWKPSLLSGALIETFLENSKDRLRKHVFSSENLLRTMDMCGGRLSMSSIEVLRKMELSIDPKKKTLLPSSGAIKNVCVVVDAYSKKVVPFTEGKTVDGYEYAEFVPHQVVTLMLKAFSLESTAKVRRIKINQAIDGAQLTKRTHHCTLGLKMIDRAAVDPSNGNLLYASSDKSTIQSRNNCFPVKIIFQRETKKTLEEFRGIMDEVKKLTNFDTAKLTLDSFPIDTAMDSDLSATWKLCAKGGAAKRNQFPCHMCCVEDAALEHPNATRCDRWCSHLHKDNPDFKCYHTEFLDAANVQAMREKLTSCEGELQLMLPEIEIICQKSKLNCSEDPREIVANNQTNDNTSIHFDYEQHAVTRELRNEYGNIVTHDLLLRKLSGTGNLMERVERLRLRLIQEYVYKSVYKGIVHSERGSDTRFLLMTECVPCILHLENRTGIKILSLMLQAALENLTKNRIYQHIVSTAKRTEQFILDIEEIFNSSIFGSQERKSNFNLPFNVKEKKFDDITMDNNRTRLFMQNCDAIISKCFATETRKDEWKDIVSKYNRMMIFLRSKEDFSDEQIREFQYYADVFFQKYLEVTSRPGITNYFHMLGSGHVAEFPVHYRNLYTHSQQGWEAFNSYLKVFFFRRTSRGGGRCDYNRVRQIARWLGRRLVWMSGVKYVAMLEKTHCHASPSDTTTTGTNNFNNSSICEDNTNDDESSMGISSEDEDNNLLLDYASDSPYDVDHSCPTWEPDVTNCDRPIIITRQKHLSCGDESSNDDNVDSSDDDLSNALQRTSLLLNNPRKVLNNQRVDSSDDDSSKELQRTSSLLNRPRKILKTQRESSSEDDSSDDDSSNHPKNKTPTVQHRR